ncbi:MAG: hypothetical protein ABIU05_04240 [Nitrospirales bacterium]
MTEVNSMYHVGLPERWSQGADRYARRPRSPTVVNPTFDQFVAETEDMLIKIYGANHQYVQSYKYATLGEGEALVNLPESAQEPSTRDVPKKGLQQRRQVSSPWVSLTCTRMSREAGHVETNRFQVRGGGCIVQLMGNAPAARLLSTAF